MVCEKCGNWHDGTYGSGRFCDEACARGFSTCHDRPGINGRISVGVNVAFEGKESWTRFPTFDDPKYGEACQRVSDGFREAYDKRLFDQLGRKSRKKRVVEEQDGKCLNCHLGSWQGQPIHLELDHIDGNRDNVVRENLRALCRNCHAQTSTFGFTEKKYGLISGPVT